MSKISIYPRDLASSYEKLTEQSTKSFEYSHYTISILELSEEGVKQLVDSPYFLNVLLSKESNSEIDIRLECPNLSGKFISKTKQFVFRELISILDIDEIAFDSATDIKLVIRELCKNISTHLRELYNIRITQIILTSIDTFEVPQKVL